MVYPRERKANTIVTWTEKRTWATRDRVWNECVVDVRYGLLKQGFCVPSTKAREGDVIEGITDHYAWYRKREQIRQHTYEDDQEL